MPNTCSGTEMGAACVLLTLSNEAPTEVPASRKRGRPLGSKNNPKAPTEVPASRKRGRPLGSKNKPKTPTKVTTKKRGRPLGSKNKPKEISKETNKTKKKTRVKKAVDEAPTKKVYRCSLCGLAGHTKKKCPTCIDLCALD